MAIETTMAKEIYRIDLERMDSFVFDGILKFEKKITVQLTITNSNTEDKLN